MTRIPPAGAAPPPNSRLTSLDALRGFVMFLMIFVNDLAGAGLVVPDAMVHFSDRHREGSGMTFVDLVFPAFLFIVGMSIPLALGRRMSKGESVGRLLRHVGLRTLSLMAVGILMVHEAPDSAALGWSGNVWCAWMYLSAMAAFISFAPGVATSETLRKRWEKVGRVVRWAGLIGLLWLALAFRGAHGERILTLAPFSLSTQWYGILGLIGWAYLVASVVFLAFNHHRTALLGCMALLMCLYAADRGGVFEGFWLSRIVGIGGTLGAQGAIAVGGVLLGAMLTSSDLDSVKARTRFTLWFAAGCAAAALLLNPLYGIGKNQATPSWCLWACAITAAVWCVFYWISDVRPMPSISRPLALAGQNVLLAYLISEMLPALLAALGWSEAYGRLAGGLGTAILRSGLCAGLILFLSTGLNRVGVRLRL